MGMGPGNKRVTTIRAATIIDERLGKIIGEDRRAKWKSRKTKADTLHHKHRRYQKRANTVLREHHTDRQWQSLLKEYEGHCAECGSTENITKDHIVPLHEGGQNTIDNIQPLCFSCNSRKQNRQIQADRDYTETLTTLQALDQKGDEIDEELIAFMALSEANA
jgi:5-methylcytosine-specific restriction endonuclease McrA